MSVFALLLNDQPAVFPPPPPLDIVIMEPIEPHWQAIKEQPPNDEPNLTWFNQQRKLVGDYSRQYDQSSVWRPS